MLEEVSSEVEVEPALQPLSGEEIKGNQSDEARSDLSARRFWITGQRTFFVIRVFHPNAQSKIVTKAKSCENFMKWTNKKK